MSIDLDFKISSDFGLWVSAYFVADINGDGFDDIVVGYGTDVKDHLEIPLRILLGNAQGFSDAKEKFFSGSKPILNNPTRFVFSDLNGDGFKDIFVTNGGLDSAPYPGATNSFYTISSSGINDASSGIPRELAFSHTAAAGDIDGDSDIDIYVGTVPNVAQIGPYFLINQNGNFTKDNTRLPEHVANLNSKYEFYPASALIDVDRDGDLDLILGGGNSRSKSRVLLNDGAGNFKDGSLLPAVDAGVTNNVTVEYLTIDFNNDGISDLLANVALDDYHGGYLQALLGNGDGTFSDATETYIGKLPDVGSLKLETWSFSRISLVDFNDDGFTDIVVGMGSINPVMINDGTNHYYALSQNFGKVNSWDPFIVGDFNHDGLKDYVVWSNNLSAGTETFRVTFGSTGSTNQQGSSADEGLLGTAQADALYGNGGNDVLIGFAGNDQLYGGNGADVLVGGAGDDYLDGGDGFDTASFSGNYADFKLSFAKNQWTVIGQGSDTLLNIEKLRFDDRSVDLTLHSSAIDSFASAILRSPLITGASVLVANGLMTVNEAKNEIIKLASNTSSVATLTYQFFTGSTPSEVGMDYLISTSGPNPTNLNSAYYQFFNYENRYINFATNLGMNGAGSSSFATEYGSLSLFDATKKAYKTIFGSTPSDEKTTILVDPARVAFFQSFSHDTADSLGTKAAMVGWLIAVSVKEDLGVYAKINDDYLHAIGDHTSPFAVNLVGVFYHPEYVYVSN